MARRLAGLRAALVAVVTATGVTAAAAHEAPMAPARGNRSAVSASALRLAEDAVPLAARYVVTVTAPGKESGAVARPSVKGVWHFYRDAEHVALLKGPIDEVWHRDAEGRVRFERVFHDEQRIAEYSPGELAALGVQVDWAALSSFVDPQVLRGLRVVSRTGAHPNESFRLAGTVAADTLQVDWLPALQLPARIVRRGADGRITEFRLDRHAPTAPSDWPVPGARSAEYLRLDAADFGDMPYEVVARKSEALDGRLGWRSAGHQH